MFHTIEFRKVVLLDVEISPKHRLERLLVREGDRVAAQLRPHVKETDYGLVEVADLFFADGTASRGVPFACFRFTN
jgi:hypothetical protein